MQGKNTIVSINFVMLTVIVGCLLSGGLCSCTSRQVSIDTPMVEVLSMQGFPSDEAGISQGVSACYAGTIQDKLIIAGGCNFPDTPAVEGGQKRFYQGVYITDFNTDSVFHWKKIGDLPVLAAYGVSITIPGGLVCIGGTNSTGALSGVYRLSLTVNDSIQIDTLPSLPCTMDNMGGAAGGNKLFVAGGNVNGKPSNAVFSLDLDNLSQGWVTQPSFPGNERVQPVCMAQDSALYILGGFASAFDGKHPSISTDGYRFSFATHKWTSLSAPTDTEGNQVCLGGGVGIALNNNWLLCTGGVNRDIFFSALLREKAMKEAAAINDLAKTDSLKTAWKTYMLQPANDYHFNNFIYLYDVPNNKWVEAGCFPQMARAGAALVGNGETYFMINGELKPGIRTPEISKILIQK